VKVTVLGSSPAWPNAGSAHAGLLLDHEGRTLVLDCGPGVLGRLRRREEWPTVDAVAISHFHLDHWGDLVPWVWGNFHRGRKPTDGPELWVYRGGRAHLERLGSLLGFPDMFERAFAIHEYDGDLQFSAAGMAVLPTRLPHYRVETYGFRVEVDGIVVAYSGDSAPAAQLTELARDADLFVCEATLAEGAADGEPRGHLSADEAVEAFVAAEARRLLLTHRPSELPAPPGIEVAYDGLEVELCAGGRLQSSPDRPQ
jgi:ribonuclease BN (tRNA processing enzyme)